MTSEPAGRKRDGLEAKFQLLARLPFDHRMKRTHILIYGFILDWYHAKYGDALASVRHIADELKRRDPARHGLGVRHIHGALSDLVGWGYLDQDKGSGKRASRYVPIWEGPQLSVPPGGNASGADPSVPPVGNTTVPPVGNASDLSVPPGGNEDPFTRTRSLDPGTRVNDEIDRAAPTAPASAPLAGASPGTAQGFEELWRTYCVKAKKVDARTAYDKLAPDADMHAAMVESARAWREATPDGVTRMHLRRWIEEECFDCDPPTAYTPRERKVKPAKAPAEMPVGDEMPKSGTLSPPLRIVDVEVIGSWFSELSVRVLVDGATGRREHLLHVYDQGGPAADHEAHASLMRVLGDDRARWPGRRVRLEMVGGTILSAVEASAPDRLVTIIKSAIECNDMGERLFFDLADADGLSEGRIDVSVKSRIPDVQESGRVKFASLCRAIGILRVGDTDELHGIPFVLKADGSFAPASAMQEAA